MKNWDSSISKWELLCHKLGDGAIVPTAERLQIPSYGMSLYEQALALFVDRRHPGQLAFRGIILSFTSMTKAAVRILRAAPIMLKNSKKLPFEANFKR